MWPALIRGSVFSSIRSSALLPSDNSSDDILPSLHDNLTYHIHNTNGSTDINNNNINSGGSNSKINSNSNINNSKLPRAHDNGKHNNEEANTAIPTAKDTPVRRCEMLSIKELTTCESKPDSPSTFPYSSWSTAHTSSPATATSSSPPSGTAMTNESYLHHNSMNQSPQSVASEEPHYETMDEYDGHYNQMYANRLLWYRNKDHGQATAVIHTSSSSLFGATAATDTSPNHEREYSDHSLSHIRCSSSSSCSSAQGTAGTKLGRKKKSISSLSSSSNPDTDREDEDEMTVTAMTTVAATTTATDTASPTSNTTASAIIAHSGDRRAAKVKKRSLSQSMDERPFACPLCERRFNRRYNLNAHIRIHDPNRKKLFDCPVCTQSFDRKHDRDRHVDALHFENKRRAHCHLCDASFTRRDALTRHMHKLHTRTSS